MDLSISGHNWLKKLAPSIKKIEPDRFAKHTVLYQVLNNVP